VFKLKATVLRSVSHILQHFVIDNTLITKLFEITPPTFCSVLLRPVRLTRIKCASPRHVLSASVLDTYCKPKS